MAKTDRGQEYIDTYPKLKKWINECYCCHRKGYNPDMPEKITIVEGSLEVYNIKRYFEPLSVNKDGLCEVCGKIMRNK